MRRVLASERSRRVIPILLLAICSSMLGEIRKRQMPVEIAQLTPPVWVMVMVGIVASALILLLMFYGLSWVAVGAGRALEGKGTARDVQAALAWGTAPVVWALLYRVPAAILAKPPSGLRVDISWIYFIAIVIAEIAVFVWWVITTSNTLAVAHHFSAPRGFATLLITMSLPFVLLIAGLLTFAMKG